MDDLFRFSVSPVEIVVRGTLMFLGLVLVLRFILRRDVGSLSITDVLFVVLIADASQNAMAGEYTSIAEGATLVATLVFWNLVLDWAAFHWKPMRRLIEPPPLPLIRDGTWIRANLKREWITTDEVESKLRQQGIEGISTIRYACLEPDGELGVIRTEGEVRKATKRSAGVK